jgi:DNA-binding transcriptional LysR family regulator
MEIMILTGSPSVGEGIKRRDGVIWLAEQGMGIALCSRLFVEASLSAGHLVEIVHHLGGRTRDFAVEYPAHRGLSAALRALTDMLVEARKGEGKL